MTIDSCLDGNSVFPFSGSTQDDFYEYVVDIKIEDQNGTASNPYPGNLTDSYLRALDYVKVTATLFCYYNSDYYAILYKNSTNSVDADWKFIYGDICDAPGNVEMTIDTIPNFQIDNVIGDHTIRVWIAYNYLGGLQDICPYSDAPWDSDTDDIIIEVIEKIDLEAPEITVIEPTEGYAYELVSNIIIPVTINVTDKTGVDTVKIDLVYNNQTTPLNVTDNGGGIYSSNITNITSLGYYEILFYANDTIETNGTSNTVNHVNNYTNVSFYLKNDAGINIINPTLNAIFSYLNVSLSFTINDPDIPYVKVYYILNGNRTNLTKSDYIETGSNTSTFVNNSLINLSQSFNLSQNTIGYKFQLLVRRQGSSNVNSTMMLVNDLSGPFGGVIDTVTISNVSNTSFEWVVFNLTSPINLTGNTKYWVTIISENTTTYLDWSYDSNYFRGEFYTNSSLDLSLRVYDTQRYSNILNSSVGINTLTVCENNSLFAKECSYTEYKTDLTPPYFELPISYTSQVELGQLQAIVVDVKDTVSPIGSVTLEFNGTNASMQEIGIVTNGKRYRTILSLTKTKSYNFTIYATNSLGYKNKTAMYFFSVNDTTSPSLDSIVHGPNASDDIDPNITITFNFTLSDESNITTVKFQYKPDTTGVYTNSTVTNIGGGNYQANFTPLNETTYDYKVYAKDSHNNELYSTNQSIDVFYERDWNTLPLIYNVVRTDSGVTVNIYNVTVINNGDVIIPFSIQKGPLVSYIMVFSNNTFNVTPNNNVTIMINVTTPETGTYPANAIISCLSSCQIQNQTVGNSIDVGGVGPFLDIKIYKKVTEGRILSNLYDMRYNDNNQYTTPHELIVEIKNIAEIYDAPNITYQFYFPDNSTGWDSTINDTTNLSHNFSLQRKNFQDTKEFSIKFLIDRKTPLGILFNLTANASAYFNGTWKNYSKLIQINVTDEEEEPPSTIIIQDPGGGGTTPPPSSPPPGGSPKTPSTGLGLGTTISYNLTVNHPENVDILRGQSKTINITISNYFKNKYFAAINFSVEGYFENQINFSPKNVDVLNFNETKTITITFNAPSYIGYSVNDISLVFDYILINTRQNISQGRSETTRDGFRLIINEVDRENAVTCLEKSAHIVRNATMLNISSNYLNEKLQQQSQALATMDFTLAQKLCFEIGNDFENILDYKSRLFYLNEMIEKRDKEGYDMGDVNRLFEIANQLFIEGEFDSLGNSLKDVESSFALQIAIEDSNLFNRSGKFIKNNFKEILVFLFIFIILSDFAYKDIKKRVVKNNLKSLVEQKKELHDKLTELQNKYYVRKDVSQEYFQIHFDKYNEKISKINEDTINYENTLERLGKKVGLGASLEEKEEKIKEKITELQKSYYIRHSIDKKVFDKMNESFKKALAKLRKEKLVAKTSKKNLFMETLKKHFEEIKNRFNKEKGEQSKKNDIKTKSL
ncbi:hypothetical protein GOV08_05215 [Candidatus Woesearchaeota archaeon]|nr:hypothetical protein [Candidatus Woesearchaeota archaeon]